MQSDQPLSVIEPFIERATREGKYTGDQAVNMKSLWSLFNTKIVKLTNFDVARMTVDSLVVQVPLIFAEYADRVGLKANSRKTYEARMNRLLSDFRRWHDKEDWSEWRTNAPAVKVTVSTGRSKPVEFVTFNLKVPGGLKGELRLPANLPKAAIPAVWAQLDALQALVLAQASVEEPVVEYKQNGSVMK